MSVDLVYQLRTVYEKVDIAGIDKETICTHRIGTEWWNGATHVVVGIDWGANVISSLEHENSEEGDKQDIQRVLASAWQKMTRAITNNTGVAYSPTERNSHCKSREKFFTTRIARPH